MIWTLLISVVLTIEGLNAILAPHHLSHNGIRSADGVFPGDFTDHLFEKYGKNGAMDMDKFRNLLKNLGIGDDDGNSSKLAGTVDKNCFSDRNLLSIFSLNTSSVDKASFKTLCPAIVQQIDSKACDKEEAKNTGRIRESAGKAWGYGFLSVAIISCASLLGVFVVPFMSKAFYKILLLFMVSLAVGVLAGSGLFHLLPKTFGVPHRGVVLYRVGVVACGIYFFFLMEYVMKLYIRYKEGDITNPCSSGHSHSHGISDSKKNKGEVPGIGVAEARLDLYKTDTNVAHTAGGLVICNGMTNKPELGVVNDAHHTTSDDINSNSEVSVQFKEPLPEEDSQKGHIAPVAWMIIIGDAVHNFIDGLAIGVAFSTAAIDGLSTSLAIFCEELPHELGDFAVLLNSGMSYKQALGFNFLSACTCFLGLIVGLILGYKTDAVRWVYALAAGMFLYISLVDMLQEATEMSFREGIGSIRKSLKMFALQSFGMLFGLAIMFVLANYQRSIKKSV